VRAFQPQNPRSIDPNVTLDKNTKRPSPALMDTERPLGLDGTMGTGLAVTYVYSGLDFSRVVLDFLFCCHNLKIYCVLGDAPRSFHGQVRPLFHSPQRNEKHGDRLRVKEAGGGVPF